MNPLIRQCLAWNCAGAAPNCGSREWVQVFAMPVRASCRLGQLEPDNYTVTFDVLTPSGKVMKNQFTFIVGGAN